MEPFVLSFKSESGGAQDDILKMVENLRNAEMEARKLAEAKSVAGRNEEAKQKRIALLQKELNALTQLQVDAAFARLPQEEQLNRLLLARKSVLEQLAAATDEEARAALAVRNARLSVRIDTLQSAMGSAQLREAERIEADRARRSAELQREAGRVETERHQKASAAQKAAAQAEEAKLRRIAALQKELNFLAQKAVDASFARLPKEEQLNQLLYSRALIQDQIAAATDREARAALRVREAKTSLRILGLQNELAPKPGAVLPPNLPDTATAGILGGITSRLKSFGAFFSSRFIGAFGGAAAAGFAAQQTRAVVQLASRLKDLEKQTSITTESLQAFTFVGEEDGASLDLQIAAIKNLQRAQIEALGNPKSDAAAAFKRQGIAIAELKKLRPEEIYLRVAAAVEKTETSAQQTVDVLKLLGREGDHLIATFKNGFAGAVAAFRDQGLGIADKTLTELDRVGDLFGRLMRRVQGSLALGASAVAEQITEKVLLAEATIGRASAILGELRAGKSVREAIKAQPIGLADTNKPRTESPAAPSSSLVESDPEQEKRLLELKKKSADALAQIALESLNREQQINFLLAQRADLVKRIRAATKPEEQAKLIAEELEASQKLGKFNQFRPEERAFQTLALQAQGKGNIFATAREINRLTREREEIVQRIAAEEDAARKEQLQQSAALLSARIAELRVQRDLANPVNTQNAINALLQRRVQILSALAKERDALKRRDLEQQGLAVAGQIADLRKQQAEGPKIPATDQLARIGLFLGAQRPETKTVETLRLIHQSIRESNRRLEALELAFERGLLN